MSTRPAQSTSSTTVYFHPSSVANVAAALTATLEEEKKRIAGRKDEKDITKELDYQVFGETSHWKVIEGIDVNEFATMVKRVAIRLEIPDDVKNQVKDDAILESQSKPSHNAVVNKLIHFAGRELDSFTYVCFSTFRRESVVDLAYAVYHVQFKLLPVVTEHEKKAKLQLFTTETEEWTEKTNRTLTGREQEYMLSHFLRRAIDGFSKSYAGSIEPQSSKRRSCVVM